MSTRQFQRAKFSTSVLPNSVFEGFTDGEIWNGWACAYFTFETAQAVLKASEEVGYRWQYDDELRSFSVKHADDPLDYEPERFDEISIALEDSLLPVYAIGAYSWTWETR